MLLSSSEIPDIINAKHLKTFRWVGVSEFMVLEIKTKSGDIVTITVSVTLIYIVSNILFMCIVLMYFFASLI